MSLATPSAPGPPLPPTSASYFDALYEQIARLPEGVTGEILRPDRIETMSRPGSSHRWTAKHCGDSLRPFDRSLGGAGWWIEVEAEIRFPGDMVLPEGRLVVPDLAGWRSSRVPERPGGNPIELVPQWCCEISSPATARKDRFEKLPLYAASGVEHIWLVDPDAHTVEVFQADAAGLLLVRLAQEGEQAELPPFESVVFDLSRWWEPPPAAP
jgi:Uma2 family endonuclease